MSQIVQRNSVIIAIKAVMTGVGQVMFQRNAISGILFLSGIFCGAYGGGFPQVGWGALVGGAVATLAGLVMGYDRNEGRAGLWGFNGVLVGCAMPTFLADTWQMWLLLIFFVGLSPLVKSGMDYVLAQWKINSLTFPFVSLTWIALFASRDMAAVASVPVCGEIVAGGDIDMSITSLLVYWLNGISQVFLVNSWIAGILFIAALAVGSLKAAFWAMAGSAVALGVSILFGADSQGIADGLYGFSPVLTAIAVGCIASRTGIRSVIMGLTAVVATVFVQAGMNVLLTPWGIPTLTAPFCITAWLFLLPPCSGK